MAEIAANIRDGITREIRFVEYKLRKRQTDKHKKSKNKNKHKQVEDTTAVRDFQSSFSDDVAKAVPSSLGEEDLQLKVTSSSHSLIIFLTFFSHLFPLDR